jgi:hypothetical protein
MLQCANLALPPKPKEDHQTTTSDPPLGIMSRISDLQRPKGRRLGIRHMSCQFLLEIQNLTIRDPRGIHLHLLKNYVPINKHHLNEAAPHHKTNMLPPKHKTFEAL